MKKLVFIISLMLSLVFEVHGKENRSDRITFGAEWGYVGVFYSGYHYNFFAPEGYRVDPRSHEFCYDTNAEVYMHIGYDLSERLNMAVYMGVSAVADYHLTVPVSLRLTRFYGSAPFKDSWFAFLDLGSGFSIKKEPQEILTGKIGGGYRMALSRKTMLDFLVSLRSVYTRPDIYYYGVRIPNENINRNNAYISALSFGMAITF